MGAEATNKNLVKLDLVLRFFVFATTLCALVVLTTSKQSELVPNPLLRIRIPLTAKFSHSPALIYLVCALAVTLGYSLLTLVVSASCLSKGSHSAAALFHLAVLDLLAAGILGSATGAGGAVAYVGYKGNSHVNWRKICDVFGKFCKHVGSSVALSLAASVALVVLVVISTYSLYRRTPRSGKDGGVAACG